MHSLRPPCVAHGRDRTLLPGHLEGRLMMNAEELRARIAQLEERLAQMRGALPRHSTSVRMMIEIEELEEELAGLRAQVAVDEDSPPAT